jgi:hypothetical protein
LSCREWEKVGHDPDYGIAPGIGLRKAKQLGTVCGVLIETEDGKRAAIHELGRVQWIENIDTGDIAEHSGNDDAIDWRAVADSAISDIVEVAGILGVANEEAHRPITALVREYKASTGIEDGWEVLPNDLRTHLNDFRDAVSQAISAGDEDGYWAHQMETLNRIELMLIDRALKKPEEKRTSTLSCGHPELDAGAEEVW